MIFSGARAEHILIDGRDKTNRVRRRGVAQIIDILGQQEARFAVELDRGQPIVQSANQHRIEQLTPHPPR